MSTQNTTTTSSSFDPFSMGVFQGFQPMIGSTMAGYVNNPYSNAGFNQQLARNQQQLGYSQQAQQQAMMQRAQAMGINPSSPLYFQQLNQMQRGFQGQSADAINNLILQANQLRYGATQSMMGYRPLQTGQTQTKTQSGLGSWLPQLAGTALGTVGMAATSGMSGLGSSFFGSNNFGGGPGGSYGGSYGLPGNGLPTSLPQDTSFFPGLGQ